jgi:hypothetical protein
VHENNLAIVLLKKAVASWKNITVAGSSSGKPDANSKVEGALLAGWGMTSKRVLKINGTIIQTQLSHSQPCKRV